MSMKNGDEIGGLIEEVYKYGDYDKRGQKAITKLASFGDATVPALMAALKDPPPSKLHGRDLMDSIQGLLWELARYSSDALIDVLEQDTSAPVSMIISALGNARSDRSLEVLIEALEHKSKYTRWLAAVALVRRRSRRAIGPLLAALRDRSPLAKFTVVEAMNSNRMYRKSEALEPLRRIVASQSVRKHHVGLWRQAQQVIDKIEKERRE